MITIIIIFQLLKRIVNRHFFDFGDGQQKLKHTFYIIKFNIFLPITYYTFMSIQNIYMQHVHTCINIRVCHIFCDKNF